MVGILLLAAHLAPSAAAQDSCPNAEFRTGPAASLPDCRAYELVSSPIPTTVAPTTESYGPRGAFETSLVRGDGNAMIFQQFLTSLPQLPGNGTHDRYQSTRTEDGWEVSSFGPSGVESDEPYLGGISSDFQYQFASADNGGLKPDLGTLSHVNFPGYRAMGISHIRKPDGSYDLVGRGSLGQDPAVDGFFINPGGSRVLFGTRGNDGLITPIQLEPEAPPTGTSALYDRDLSGGTKVVSLLPGDVTPTEDARWMGASSDGQLVGFKVNPNIPAGPLYVRVNNEDTYEVTPNDNTFAGIYAGHVFYGDSAPGGFAGNPQVPSDLFSFDTDDQSTTQITNTGDARFVNVSDDGSRVYFMSPSQIGGEGTAGEQNLYVWERTGDSITYVDTLSNADIGFDHPERPEGLATWTYAVGGLSGSSPPEGRGANLTRATEDGSILVFVSSAQLTSFDNDGLEQVYRYDANSEAIECVSCSGAEPAEAPAGLETPVRGDEAPVLVNQFPAANLTEDGDTIVFDAAGPLLPADTNGMNDVYRWNVDDGLALISTGKSNQDSALWAVTPDASDIMFRTAPDLVPYDQTGTIAAIYTARVNGGLVSQFETTAEADDCTGDECQQDPVGAPADHGPDSDGQFPGNPDPGLNNAACDRFDQKASKAAKKAKKLKKKAKKDSGKRAKKLRKKAKKQQQKSKRSKQKAIQCRGGSQ